MQASLLLSRAFIGFALLVAAAFPLGVYAAWRRTGGAQGRAFAIAVALTTVWLMATYLAAASGRLSFEARPPTMVILLVLILLLAIGLGVSPVGRRLALGLPLAVLVGFHGFRVGVELLLHRAYVEGLMPVQMSYEGRNFDIVSGITAIVVGGLLAAGRMPRWGVWLWNCAALLLLANILTIAILSSPVPFRVFMNEPSNVWVTHAPWVWLPAIFVLAALVGHLLVFRRLLLDGRAPVRAGYTERS